MSDAAYSVSDFMRAATAQRKALAQALEGFRSRLKEGEPRMAELERRSREAVDGLARLLLPEMSAESVKRARRLSACASLLSTDPMADMKAEAERLAADIARMEADPRYAKRLELRAPGVGTLSRELAELEEYRASISDVLGRAAHPRLDRLLSAGYGTDGYSVGWWRLAFYSDWKAGDEILERFPGKKDFGEVRDEVLRARGDIAEYDSRIEALRREIGAGERLEKERDEAAGRLSKLSSIHLEDWRRRLADHALESPEIVAERLSGEGDLEVLLKTGVGLRKKRDYLGQLALTQLSEPAARIEEALAKLDRDIAKYSRPKRAGERFEAQAFERRFRDRSESFGKSLRRYDSASGAIHSFDDYGRASLTGDFLWWDLMTDGRIDGNFIPEVEGFRESHPDYTWRSESFDDDRAAAAAADADRAGHGGGLADAS